LYVNAKLGNHGKRTRAKKISYYHLLNPFGPVQFLGYGVFVTGDSILLLLVMGPTRSRAFINALHFFMRELIIR
jgi:hypothetical protein